MKGNTVTSPSRNVSMEKAILDLIRIMPFISPLNDPNNYGGHQFAVSFGFQFQPIPLHIIELIATMPIYQDLNGPQLRQDYMIQATYYVELPTKKSRRYKGFKAPKELGF